MTPSVKACAAAALLLAACADKPTSPSDISPQNVVVTTGTLRITLLGPDGTNLCNSLPAGFNVRVRAVDRTANPDVSRRAKTFVCPVNSDTMTNLVFGSDYIVNTALYSPGGSLIRLPDTYVQPNGFSFTSNMERNVRLYPGELISGRAFVDGKYAPDINLTLTPATLTNYFAATTNFKSNAEGLWRSTQGERPFLQKGLSYTSQCGGHALGLTPPPGPEGPFLFPTERTAFQCYRTSSPSKRWSHRATNMTFTAWDGVWGAAVEPVDTTIGLGWGLQYPVAPTEKPRYEASSSHSFYGGLMFAVNNSLVSIADMGDFAMECGATCRDVSLGTLNVFVNDDKSRRVTWQAMSDEGFTDGRGLTVSQTTYDGIGGDYILFRVELRNRTDARMTVYAGAINDWDVQGGANPGANVGGMNNDVMYVAASSTSGPYMGTVFFGSYATHGNRFLGYSGTPTPVATQVDWLKGLANNTSFGPSDLRALQSVGPISIAAGSKKTVYFAIVGGTTQAEMMTNRNAAAAHYASLTSL
jgi:hypothetical protein